MNLNLFSKEIKRNFPGLIIWMAVLTFLISVTMSVYSTFLENQSKILGMLSIIPKGALEFKGISNFNDLLSVLGFYAVNNIIYMMVLGSVYAIVLSSNILLKEEYNKTAEYLMTRPLTRSEIFSGKLAVVIINIFLLNLFTAIIGFICLELFKNGQFSIKAFIILSFYTFLLNLLFSSAGLFMSVLVKRAKPITTLSIGLVIVMYFLFTISKITQGASKIGYLSPFRYVNTNVGDPAYGFDWLNLLYFIGLSALLILLSYRIYLKKDIYT